VPFPTVRVMFYVIEPTKVLSCFRMLTLIRMLTLPLTKGTEVFFTMPTIIFPLKSITKCSGSLLWTTRNCCCFPRIESAISLANRADVPLCSFKNIINILWNKLKVNYLCGMSSLPEINVVAPALVFHLNIKANIA
jgi:hypothetical protein